MKERLYIDTSVIGGYFDDEFSEISIRLIEEFISGKKMMLVSDLTLKELESAPSKVSALLQQIPENNKEYLFLNEEAKLLAQKYIEEKSISSKFLLDAQHIAIATVADIAATKDLLNNAYRGEVSKQGWTTEAGLIAGDIPAFKGPVVHIAQGCRETAQAAVTAFATGKWDLGGATVSAPCKLIYSV